MKSKLSDFENLNHIFDENLIQGPEIIACSICKLKIWIGEEGFWIYQNCSWKKLDISCEEMQIKNILE